MSEDSVYDLRNSKFYALARSVRLFEYLIPNLPTLMAVESELNESFPREDDYRDHTRVIISYINHKGNESLYQITRTPGYDSHADIDEFLQGYSSMIADGNSPEDPVQLMSKLVYAALSFSVSVVLNLDPELQSSKTVKELAQWVITSMVTVIYDNPLDVLICVKEGTSDNPDDDAITLTNMWMVKPRPEVA